MNRIYSSVWNEAQGRYVVAHERARTQGRPKTRRCAVAVKVASVVVALGTSAAWGACGNIASSTVISSAVTGPCAITGSSASLLIDNNGTLSGGARGVDVSVPTSGGIANSGLLAGSALGIRIINTTLGGGITNSGQIKGDVGASSYAVFASSASIVNGITNRTGGTISGDAGFYLKNGTIDHIQNSGTITSANGNALWLEGSSQTGSILNGASGRITSSNMGIQLHHSTISGQIENAGTITAAGRAIQINADQVTPALTSKIGGIVNSGAVIGGSSAINIATNSTVAGSIANSGLIAGQYVGLYLNASTVTGSIANSAGGTISGGTRGIVVFNGTHVGGGISNQGLIASSSGMGIRIRINSTVSGGIANTGTIGGANVGVFVGNTSAIVGGLRNSGTISGGTYAVQVDNTSSIDAIRIGGANTAKFIGEVLAPNTPVTIEGGASYSMDNGQLFTVQGFTNAGTLNIGAGNTGTVAGNFTNTGVFSPVVGGMASYGKLVVTGTAALSGQLHVQTAGTPSLNVGGTLAGVVHAGAISGRFDSVSSANNLFSWTANYGATDVDLVVGPGVAFREVAVTTGQTPAASAGAALDRISATSNGSNPVVLAFLNIPQAQVPTAITQTLPLLTGGSTVAAGTALTGINRVIQARMDGNRGLSSGEDFYGDRKLWMKPFGSWADQSDRNGVSGYKARVAGLAFGADTTLSATSRIGIAVAYAKANIDGNSSSAPNRQSTDVYQLIGYGSVSLDANTEFSYQADLGQNKNDGRRDLLAFGTSAASSYTSTTAHAGVGLGRSFQLSEATSFTPSVRLDYTHIRDAAYAETGAGVLNLKVAGRTTEELVTSVDGKFAHKLNEEATLLANMGVAYDSKAKTASITAAFAGAPDVAFTTTGMEQKPWTLRAGLGYVYAAKSGLEVTARYDAEHRAGFSNQTVSAKFRWSF